jgi:hypothetical protein
MTKSALSFDALTTATLCDTVDFIIYQYFLADVDCLARFLGDREAAFAVMTYCISASLHPALTRDTGPRTPTASHQPGAASCYHPRIHLVSMIPPE